MEKSHGIVVMMKSRFPWSLERISDAAAGRNAGGRPPGRVAWALALLLLAVFCLPEVSRADQWGELRYVETVVNIRRARTTDSLIAFKLLPGQAVRVDFLENGWYAVFPPDETVRDESRATGVRLCAALEVLFNGFSGACVFTRLRTRGRTRTGIRPVGGQGRREDVRSRPSLCRFVPACRG